MKYYSGVKKFVEESFKQSGKFADELRHFWRTAYWLKKLYPKAGDPMLIAAVAHDLERAFRKTPPRDTSKVERGLRNVNLFFITARGAQTS